MRPLFVDLGGPMARADLVCTGTEPCNLTLAFMWPDWEAGTATLHVVEGRQAVEDLLALCVAALEGLEDHQCAPAPTSLQAGYEALPDGPQNFPAGG